MDKWTVLLTHGAYRQLRRLPKTIQDMADLAIADLEWEGLKPAGWDVRKTADREYRLRLTYRYRLRYRWLRGLRLEIEIFYIGHRREAYR